MPTASNETEAQVGNGSTFIRSAKGTGPRHWKANSLFATSAVIGGSLALSSEEGKGTKVHLSIPLVPAPHGFADRLDIPNGALLVMVDDDPLIHQAVKLKVQSLLSTPVVHLSSVGEFETWLVENGPGELGERVYLFDYDLKDRAGNGLDLIERHGLPALLFFALYFGKRGKPEGYLLHAIKYVLSPGELWAGEKVKD